MTLEIRVAGVDITDDVVIAGARFEMGNGPNPGDFELRVKDPQQTYAFRAGEPIEVDFAGVPCFVGYVFVAQSGFSFPVVRTDLQVVKMWTLRGVDINILFRKRFLFNQSDGTKRIDLELRPGTSDLVYLSAIMSHLTIGDDDLTTYFQQVDSPNPDVPGIAVSTGDSWERAMAAAARIPGAIWGIRPARRGRFNPAAFDSAFAADGVPYGHRVVYWEDNDTETAPFAISDNPSEPTSFGYSTFEWLEDASQMVNDAWILGVGLGSASPTYERVTDTASIAAHGRWQNGDNWRYDLYRPDSVHRVVTSLVYGSPSNLHGPKDPSIKVKARVRQPGLMAGDKVRIISDAFGDEIVLPIRRLKTTFVDRTKPLFDLEATWDIDEPVTMFDFPPFPGIGRLPPTDKGGIDDPCQPILLWGAGGGSWTSRRSDPRLGSVNSFFGEINSGAVSFINKRRYWSLQPIFFLAPDNGVDDSGVWVHYSHSITFSTTYGFGFDFTVPQFTETDDFHFPGEPGGMHSNVKKANFSLDLYFLAANTDPDVFNFTPSVRVCAVVDGVAYVNGQGIDTPQTPGDGFHFEKAPDGGVRIWPNADARPAAANVTLPAHDFGLPMTRPVAPNVYEEPRLVLAFNIWGDVDERSTHLMITNEDDGTERTRMERFLIATDANRTPEVFGNSVYWYAILDAGDPDVPSELMDGYRLGLIVSNAFFVPVASTASPMPPCVEIVPQTVGGEEYCQTAIRLSDTEFGTHSQYVSGSTRVEVDGLEQRRGIDYIESWPDPKIVFPTDAVPEGSAVRICYETLL